jgi:ubiquinol oxidase
MNSLSKVVDSEGLKTEQEKTLSSKRRRYGLLAQVLFFVMDILYGRKKSLPKCMVLEIIARVPYQAWEHVAYIAMTQVAPKPAFARRIFDYVVETRHQQDNEQWHMFILEEMLANTTHRRAIKYFFLPQVMAFLYYHISWVLYVVNPRFSYSLNADFEDHAEHEYMCLVQENPELETLPWVSDFKIDYGNYGTVADLLRRIGLDERIHKEESLKRMEHPRFS